jgi:RNA polymerase sigma-70 factor, ECF subfamily
MKLDEHTLVEQIKRGDNAAVRGWFADYYREMYRFIAQKITVEHDIEELTQETFIQCLKNIQLFNGDASLLTWMKSVARHEVADYYRKKYAKRALQTLPLHQLVLGESVHDAHEVSERVKQALIAMRVDYQELLLLKYVDGKTVKTIAAELNKTVKAVEADLFRARQDFKELYAISGSR